MDAFKTLAPKVEEHGNFVDGHEVDAGDSPLIDVLNPATGLVIARIQNSTAEDINDAMRSARSAFDGHEWGGMPIRARARLINKLADVFEDNLDEPQDCFGSLSVFGDYTDVKNLFEMKIG